jgi:hypothetical protein
MIFHIKILETCSNVVIVPLKGFSDTKQALLKTASIRKAVAVAVFCHNFAQTELRFTGQMDAEPRVRLQH